MVWDVHGNSYLDLIGGIAVSALGHNHPAIVEAVTAQVSKLAHISNLFAHEGQVARPRSCSGAARARDHREGVFANSGTEANEAAVKLDRRIRGASARFRRRRGFHGRSMGSLSLTGKASIREAFSPIWC